MTTIDHLNLQLLHAAAEQALHPIPPPDVLELIRDPDDPDDDETNLTNLTNLRIMSHNLRKSETPPNHACLRSCPSNGPDPVYIDRMSGKCVCYRDARTVLTVKALAFEKKKLCDGLVLNPGDACAFRCTYCYVGPAMLKVDKPVLDAHEAATGRPTAFQDVVIRRKNAVGILRSQLLRNSGQPKFDPDDRRIVFSSTLVDVAANRTLLAETAELCNLLLEHTGFQIRLLSKSAALARLVTDRMIPERHHPRLILGFSTGTLDDRTAAAIEPRTSSPTARIKALRTLQDLGIRTFGMICPSLPQDDYQRFSDDICAAIRADLCEHVWAEAINLRGPSLIATAGALRNAGKTRQAQLLDSVSGSGHAAAWEEYARSLFLAHTANIPGERLRFLQYVTPDSAAWWAGRVNQGAVLLGRSSPAE